MELTCFSGIMGTSILAICNMRTWSADTAGLSLDLVSFSSALGSCVASSSNRILRCFTAKKTSFGEWGLHLEITFRLHELSMCAIVSTVAWYHLLFGENAAIEIGPKGIFFTVWKMTLILSRRLYMGSVSFWGQKNSRDAPFWSVLSNVLLCTSFDRK